MSVIASLRIALVALAALSLTACGINSVPEKQEVAKAKWGDVQNAYQRRADLIPNLVSTVRAAATSEGQILTEVTQARANATRITVSDDQLTDPAAMARFAEAQSRLTVTLQRLQEAYPNLQSQARFADLMTALEGSENRINTARDRYNEAVRDYNTEIRTFPSIIGAKIVHGAKPMVPFEATDTAQTAPTVDLDNIGAAPAASPAANDNAPAEQQQPAAAAN
jgi:LemA protein